MASLSSTVYVCQGLRPCFVDGERCLFHKWVTDYQPRGTHMITGDGEDNWEVAIYEVTMALVEHQDGSVTTESMELVRFADAEGRFSEFDFGEPD